MGFVRLIFARGFTCRMVRWITLGWLWDVPRLFFSLSKTTCAELNHRSVSFQAGGQFAWNGPSPITDRSSSHFAMAREVILLFCLGEQSWMLNLLLMGTHIVFSDSDLKNSHEHALLAHNAADYCTPSYSSIRPIWSMKEKYDAATYTPY